MKNKDKDHKYWETLAASQAKESFELYLQEYEENELKVNIFGYAADQIQAMKETRDFESYREGFKHGLDMKDVEIIDLIQQHEEKKMAKQIISKKDLDILFQNELQKAAFLRIMDGLVVVMEPEPIVHLEKHGVVLQTHPSKGLQLFVHDKLVYQHNT